MSLAIGDKVTFRIERYNPEMDKVGHFQDYEVDYRADGMMILDGLNQIRWEQDGTLAYRRSCREGVCGSDGINVNGVNMVGCVTHISDLKSSVITIRPLPGMPVVKDLVSDFTDFFNKYYVVKPYLVEKTPPPGEERLQSIEDRNKLNGLYECILCACCSSSCPSFWADPDYLGPAALLNSARFTLDSRDEGKDERLDIVDDKHGLWRCHTIMNCIQACPKELNPTKAIAQLQNEVVARKY